MKASIAPNTGRELLESDNARCCQISGIVYHNCHTPHNGQLCRVFDAPNPLTTRGGFLCPADARSWAVSHCSLAWSNYQGSDMLVFWYRDGMYPGHCFQRHIPI